MIHKNITKLTCILFCVLIFSLIANSCLPDKAVLTSETSDQTNQVEESASPETATLTTAEELISLEVREISFLTEDNIKIAGRIFGKSETAVILSHMYPTDQSSWDDFADRLMQNGYEVITFDFRGYGKSEGKKEIDKIYKDILAALKFVREDGAKNIVLIGASMGGTASLFIGSQNIVNGVIAISAPVEFQGLTVGDLKNIKCAKLFIAGEKDGSAVQSAKYFYENSTDPREIVIYPTDEHGTYIFDGPYGEDLNNKILEFITSNVTDK